MGTSLASFDIRHSLAQSYCTCRIEGKTVLSTKSLLRKNEEDIASRYGGLSVDCLSCHFEDGRPTLKDASTLSAMTINPAKKVDVRIHESFGRDDLEAWLEYYGILQLIKKVNAETKSDKVGGIYQTYLYDTRA